MKSKIHRRTMLAVAVATGMAGGWFGAPVARAQDRVSTLVARWSDEHSGPMIGVMTEPNDRGVSVMGLLREGPAEAAGIGIGDLIVSIDGHSLTEPIEGEDELVRPSGMTRARARLQWLLGQVPEGESIEVGIERDGEAMTFTVVPESSPPETFWDVGYLNRYPAPSFDSINEMLRSSMDRIGTIRIPVREFNVGRLTPRFEGLRVEAPELDSLFEFRLTPSDFSLTPRALNSSIRVFETGDWPSYRFERFGGNRLEVIRLNPELGSYFGTEEGVLVLDVDGESTLGLRPGDVVVRIGGRQVDDVSDMRRILASYEDDEKVDFGIWRDGAEATVVGTIR